MATRQPRLPGGSGDPDDIEDAITVESEDVTKLQGDIDSEESKITQEFDADAKDVTWLIKLYNVEDRSGKMVYLFQCMPDDLPIIDRLRDEYGTGTYKARVYKSSKLHRVLVYHVRAPKNNPSPLNSGPSHEMSAINQAIRQQGELLTQLIQRQSNAPASDPLDGIVKLATAFKAIMPAPAAPVDPASMFGVFFKGMEMMKDMGGGGGDGGGSSFIDLARDAVKAIGPALAANAMAAGGLPAPAMQRPAAPKPSPEKQQQMPSNQPTSEETAVPTTSDFPLPLRLILSQQLPGLINKAARGADPALYADFIADNVPLETIAQHMSDDNLLEKLGRINPQVLQFPEWFTALRDNLRDILEQQGFSANNSPHAPVEPSPANDPDGDSGGSAGG